MWLNSYIYRIRIISNQLYSQQFSLPYSMNILFVCLFREYKKKKKKVLVNPSEFYSSPVYCSQLGIWYLATGSEEILRDLFMILFSKIILDCSEIFLKRYRKTFMKNFRILYTFQWLLMLILLEILVILLFLTSGAQLQQVGVGMFSLLIILAETLILVGMYISFAFLPYANFITTNFITVIFKKNP